MKLKAYGLETVQLLDDGTHDVEGVFDLPNTKDGKEQSIVVRLSKFGNESPYMFITHEIDGYHTELGGFKIPQQLFETASGQ